MKRFILTIICVFILDALITDEAKAQAFNPYYASYIGYGYMPMANGYYVGNIFCGYPHGQGYAYYYDFSINTWVAYQGGFHYGMFHGEGQAICNYGCIAGVWYMNNFVQQRNISQYQIQQTYDDIMQSSQNYAPQNSNTITLPPGTEIKEIDSSSELGRKLTGKMWK